MSDQIRTDDEILETVAKLLKLAEKAGSPEEAATAAAKAQEIMTKYNLSEVALERKKGARDGKREQAWVEGGHYAFQREMFEAIAKMNFCIAWNQFYWTEVDFNREAKYDANGRWRRGYQKGDTIRKSRFKIVGRVANVAATRAMYSYLNTAITRILREKVQRSDGVVPKGSMMDSWAVSFREGAVANIMSRIWEARKDAEKARQAKAKADAKMAGAASATALTIVDVEDAEYQANYDELHGSGAWAKRLKAREEAAEIRRREQAEMVRLAKEDPEEYRRREEEERKRRRRQSAGRGPRERYVDPSAYSAGYKAAEKISLHQQVDDKKPVALIGGAK